MKIKLLSFIITALAICGCVATQFAPTAYAAKSAVCGSGDVPTSVQEAAGCNNDSDSQFPSFVINIINGIIGVSGLIAVIFVLIGGYGYMTSTGDSGKLEKAKKTILYACIGLATCVLSFTIVNFTYNNIIRYQPSSDSDSNSQENS